MRHKCPAWQQFTGAQRRDYAEHDADDRQQRRKFRSDVPGWSSFLATEQRGLVMTCPEF
jgi:hypothetical protein